MMQPIGRRQFLRGSGGVTLSLPFLELTAGRAAQAAAPLRFVVFFHPQGTSHKIWKPAQTGSTFELGPMLSPLAPFQAKINVLSGLGNLVPPLQNRANAHASASRSCLTAHRYVNPSAIADRSAGPSIDQVVNRRIGGGRPTLNLQVGALLDNYQLLYSAPGVSVSSKVDPRTVWRDLTGAAPGAPAAPAVAERLRGKRNVVLDAVKDSIRTLEGTLGAEDRVRLQAHLARVEEYEATLRAPAAGSAGPAPSCARAALPVQVPANPDFNTQSGRNDDVIGRAHIHNAVMALACGQSAVATIQYANNNAPDFPWLKPSPSGKWHDLVHSSGSGQMEAYNSAFRWYGQELAYLLSQLDAVSEGGQSLLASTLVLWISEFGNGAAHASTNLPVVLAGGLGGRLKTGRHLSFEGRTTNDLYVTLLNLLGGDDRQFGLPELNRGPLSL